MSKSTTLSGARDTRQAKRDPEGVRRDILSVAMEEFSQNGLSGARIDEIAARTRTSKRMIYYYFSDKESLYQRVLEEAYAKVRGGESDLEAGRSGTGGGARQALSVHLRSPQA